MLLTLLEKSWLKLGMAGSGGWCFNFTVTISINKGVTIFRLKLFSTLMPSTGQSQIIALFGWKVVNKRMILTFLNEIIKLKFLDFGE